MARKSVRKSKKTVGHYLKIYFLSIVIASVVFFVGGFFNSKSNCANSISCKKPLVTRVDNDTLGIFQGRKFNPPKVDLAKELSLNNVLGVRVPSEEKHIYVDLSKQTLYAYEGKTKFMQTLISSGKWGRTPTGNWNVWTKLPVTRMTGGQGADFYDLPNVRWVMYFYKDYGFHTAYWHNNFGHPMSHGCINMRQIDAKKLFEWADGPEGKKKGTAVSICDKFTGPDKCEQS